MKPLDNCPASAPGPGGRPPAGSRPAYRPRSRRLAEGTNTPSALLEFPSERESEPLLVVPPSRVDPLPAPPPPRPQHVKAPGIRVPARIVWLLPVLVAVTSLVWLALRDSSSSDASLPLEVASVAAAAPAPPVAEPPPSAAPPVAAQAPPARRATAAAAATRESGPRPTRPEPARAAPRHVESQPRAALPAKPAPVPAQAAGAFQGTLVVHSEPAGARVLLNGVVVGSTPLTLPKVPVGSRVIRVEADGYQPWSSAVRVVAGQQVRVTATLKR